MPKTFLKLGAVLYDAPKTVTPVTPKYSAVPVKKATAVARHVNIPMDGTFYPKPVPVSKSTTVAKSLDGAPNLRRWRLGWQ